jgi:hypothetical protein
LGFFSLDCKFSQFVIERRPYYEWKKKGKQ